MKDNGIGTIVDVGSNMETSAWIVDAVNRYPMMYGAVGVHPSDTAELKESDIDTLKKYAAMDRILAIGEIGLDYYWDEPEREIQKKWFEAQIELAREVRLPIIIHSRDAAKDTYDIMKSLHAEDISVCTIRQNRIRDRLPISVTRTKQRQEKFFSELELCSRSAQSDQRD